MIHAKRSPSGAAGWLECAGWASDPEGSSFADEGTAAHAVAEMALTSDSDAAAYRGRLIEVQAEGEPMRTVEVNDEMVLAVQDYLDYVRGVVKATSGTLMVEQRLPIQHVTGEPDAHGTSDVVILTEDELIVVDLKYGRGVAVDAQGNPQLQIYALGAHAEFSLAQDFKTVRMVIHQPRLGAVSEWVQTVEELQGFAQHVTRRIEIHDANPDARNPGNKQCRWCANKAECPALRTEVLDQFENVEPHAADVEALADAMSKADMIEAWLKAIRAEVESKLLAGVTVPGYKLVQGKKGNRAWSDKDAVEALFKSMRLKTEEMYDLSLISPASAEKLAKAKTIGPRQWPKVQTLITQAEGKPSVAPESDKRPALVMSAVADDFDDVTATAGDACDLA